MPGRDWSLLGLTRHARITRGVARSLVRSGLLDDGPYGPVEVVCAQVGAALLTFPDPTNTGDRDRTAVRLTRALCTDPRTDPATLLVVTATTVQVADRGPQDLLRLLPREPGMPVLLLPVGYWFHRPLPPTVEDEDTTQGQPGIPGLPGTPAHPRAVPPPSPVTVPEAFPDGEPW